jgi:hypothetical protein
MSATPVLAFPNFNLQFVIETDACDKGVEAFFSRDGHPVAYFSKALSVNNQRLSTCEKEFLAILMAVDKWRNYMSRQPFLIRTDHKSLCHLQDQSLSTEMQRKAMTKLAGLPFKLQYKKGAENKTVDALSRVGQSYSLQSSSMVVPVWIQEVINSYAVDTHAQQLLQELAIVSPNSQGYSLSQGLIRYKKKIWVGANTGLQTKIISDFHSSPVGGHSGIQATFQRVQKLFYWQGLKQDVDSFIK